MLSRFNQKQYANGIAERALDLRLEELMGESDVLSKYRFVRAAGNKTSDEDLIAYLLGDKWETLTSYFQDLLVYKVIKRADKINKDELFSLIRSGKLDEVFGAVTAADTTGLLSDEMIVKRAFENLGFKGPRSFIESPATVKDPLVVLGAFVADEEVQAEMAKSYRSMKAVSQDVPDEKIVKTILEKMGYKYWDRLLPKDRELIVGQVIESSLMPEWLPPYFDDRQVEVLFTDNMEEEDRERIIKIARDIDETEDLAPCISAVKASVARLFTPGMTGADRSLIIGAALRVDAEEFGLRVNAIVHNADKLFSGMGDFHRATLTHHHLQKTEDEIHELGNLGPLAFPIESEEVQVSMRAYALVMFE